MGINLQYIKDHVTSRSDKFGLLSTSDVTCRGVLALISRMEAAEARAAALAAQLEAVTAQYKTLQEMYLTDHDQRIRQEERIKQLESEIKYLRSTDHAADLAFEKMSPLDWRDAYGLSDETPLGQALDGIGDEV